MERSKAVKIILLVSLVICITFLHYFTELKAHLYHIFYQGLYFLPVMLAGFWFGLRGALITCLSITMLYLPFTFIYWKGFSAGDFNNIMEMILYNVVGAIIGRLRDQECADQKHLCEAERLTAMGKAISGLAHDMRNPLIAIGGISRSVQKNLEDDSPLRKKMSMVIEEAQRLENMVREMLGFSRPLELHRSKEDVNRVVDQSLAIIADMAQQRKCNCWDLSS